LSQTNHGARNLVLFLLLQHSACGPDLSPARFINESNKNPSHIN
jgi:hypothetical protein